VTQPCFSRGTLLALDTEVHHVLAALDILYPQLAELLAAHTVIEQGGKDGAISHALNSVGRRYLQQPTRLRITQGRRAAFIAIGHGALDAVDRIAGDGVIFTEIVEPGREGRELATDAEVSEFALFEVLAPGNDLVQAVDNSGMVMLELAAVAHQIAQLTDRAWWDEAWAEVEN
jgi:hypothetical protein